MAGSASAERAEATNHLLPALLLGVVLVALLLRFWRLGVWNFEATEMFTLRDSLHPRLTNPRPLSYLLNYYLIRPFRPLDEFGLRFLPALFGTLAVPALYFACRRLIGGPAALFGAALVAISPLQVYYSQFARYWSLVFLFCAIYPYALYRGVRDHDRRALAIGVISAVLAALAHPVSVLLLGGPALWLLFAYLQPRRLREAWSRSAVRWGALAAAVLIAISVVRFIPILHGWITMHDKNPGSGQFLLRAPMAPGLKLFFYLVAYGESLTLPLVLTSAVGLYLLWRRDRTLATYLVSLALFPIVFLTLISLRTPVSTYYLLPTAPVFYLGAGVFLGRLLEVDWKAPRWLMAATVAVAVVSSGLPTLVSQYLNGRRYDFRTVASWIDGRMTKGDVVYSDQHMVLAHYLKGAEVQRLRYDTIPLARAVREVGESRRDGALWIVAPAPAHALRTNLRQGGLAGWIYDHCRLSNTIGMGRVDFRQQYLQVYDCPAVPNADEGRSAVTASPEGASGQDDTVRATGAPRRASTSR
jgi:hypothetical protein